MPLVYQPLCSQPWYDIVQAVVHWVHDAWYAFSFQKYRVFFEGLLCVHHCLGPQGLAVAKSNPVLVARGTDISAGGHTADTWAEMSTRLKQLIL